jgi:hypothetical protein
MALLHTLRRTRVAIARAVLPVFVASWLGLVFQPCIAGELAGTQPLAGQSEHAGHDCPHCPPKAVSNHDCGTALAIECDAVGVPAIPAKDVSPTTPDLGAWLNLPADVALCHDPGRRLQDRAGSVPPHPPPDSLQQRYCRYLK